MTARRIRRSPRVALAMLTILASLVSVVPSTAVSRPTKFADTFDTLGPLKGTAPSHPYEIRRGTWEVEDLGDIMTFGNPRRVLVQKSTKGTPKEPVVFIRDAAFRSFSAQVTGALIDNVPSASLGLVFRAPILSNQSADADNMYLFSAINTGFAGGFVTGQAYMLFKRVGEGYFPLSTRIAHTWTDLSRPHDYKVIMTNGHIQAFVDGRLVIEHTDVPSGDQPTENDPFPGLPYHSGSVGLRTSNARAWFDDFVVIADDAYEGRANAINGYASIPVPADARRGTEHTLSNELTNVGLNIADTGFVYSDKAFERSVVRPYDNGGLVVGPRLRTRSVDGMTESIARLNGLDFSFTDPTSRVGIHLTAAKVETKVTASCTATTSDVHFASSSLTITLGNGDGQPGTTIGPIPINSSYPPNSFIYRQPGVVTVMAHRTRSTSEPQFVDTSALVISFPTATASIPEINVANNRILPGTRTGSGTNLEVSIGDAVAGRHCSPMVESTD